MTERMDIANIKIGKRFRKDLGDIDALAESIERLGLLQPVVVTPERRLVAGLRRIEAAKKLGWDSIPILVADGLGEAVKLLEAERDENTCRENLLPSEAVAIGRAIAKAYRPKAEAAKRAGGGDKKSPAAKSLTGNSRKRSRQETEASTTTAVAAKAVGMDRRTFEKATAVVDRGGPSLIAEMDRTGKVSGVHRKLKTREAAAAIAAEPPSLPKGPFRVLVVDPPWQYDNRAEDPTHRAANPYPSMSVPEIKAMDVGAMGAKDSILWLWTTNAFLRDAFDVAEAWGFTYKTLLTWVKDKMGLDILCRNCYNSVGGTGYAIQGHSEKAGDRSCPLPSNQERGRKSRRSSSQKMRSLQEGVQCSPQVKPLLQSEMRGKKQVTEDEGQEALLDGRQTAEFQGLLLGERIQVSVHAEAPDGKQGGLRRGTSSRHGASDRQNADSGRSGSSQKQKPRGQQAGKSHVGSQSSGTHPKSLENETPGVSQVPPCSRCGARGGVLVATLTNRLGTGDWLRGKTEHCLLCVKGKPTIMLTNQTTAIAGPLRKHSQKPDEFYAMVEKLCPGSKVELFQREARDGWIGHGSEVPK